MVCTYCMDVSPWRYWAYCRPSILGYVAIFVLLVLGVWTATRLLINTTTSGRCWSALLGLPPRFGHVSFGALGLVQQSPGTLPNSGTLEPRCWTTCTSTRTLKDHRCGLVNSWDSETVCLRPPLRSSHQAGAHEKNGTDDWTSWRRSFRGMKSSKTPRKFEFIRAERSSNGSWRRRPAPAESSRTRAHGRRQPMSIMKCFFSTASPSPSVRSPLQEHPPSRHL